MNRKTVPLIIVLLFSVLLFGCERKTTTDTTDTIESISTAVSENETSSQETSDTDADEQASETNSQSQQASQSDTSISETYLKNLSNSTTKVQKALKDTASFCTAIVEMPSGQTTSQASQSFFFNTTNEGLKDWYWVVTIDNIEKKEIHSLVAKSAFKDDFECSSLSAEQIKLSFDQAYARAEEVGALLISVDIVKTKIIQSGGSWKLVQFDESGQSSTVFVDAQNGYVSQEEPTSASNESIIGQ